MVSFEHIGRCADIDLVTTDTRRRGLLLLASRRASPGSFFRVHARDYLQVHRCQVVDLTNVRHLVLIAIGRSISTILRGSVGTRGLATVLTLVLSLGIAVGLHRLRWLLLGATTVLVLSRVVWLP